MVCLIAWLQCSERRPFLVFVPDAIDAPVSGVEEASGELGTEFVPANMGEEGVGGVRGNFDEVGGVIWLR
jgi:hypothetical protein